MGDMKEVGEILREWSKERRAYNRAGSPEVLRRARIAFESKNDGAHLIVTHAGAVVDFWPGTGRYIFRTGRKGRGVHGLIQDLRRWEANRRG